ncbi:MAG: uroporphyrinogen-III C-methyltransferase [Methylococcales bacterium]|nr:uroporphyrinogen-III C-methyltransferase [Methylococcales bacterium]
MDYFPIFLNLTQKPCLVIGGGGVAVRKIKLLAKAHANITVISDNMNSEVRTMTIVPTLNLIQRKLSLTDILDYQLVVCATDNETLNKEVAEVCHKNNILVNVVDNPALCSFIFPAIIDRSPVIIAVSTGGASPVLARLLRAKIETVIPAQFGALAQLAAKFREKVKQTITIASERRLFWEKILQGSVAELIFTGKTTEADTLLTQKLAMTQPLGHQGEVYLIGAGPGDPDLLTFKALRLMQQADVVVYDRLVSTEILELARRDSELIYVGKKRDNHSMPQDSINQLLASLAKQGKRVARLKGGDPFIFGRGGEEIETLMAQGIRFQVVPGITAASGCASYAGIPLTHRDYAQSCTFVTGHLKDGSINLNWQQLTAPHQTIVIYMGLIGLEQICTAFMEHGCDKSHPIALIQQGTTSSQKVIVGTLESLPKRVKTEAIKPPTLIIIGKVVTLHSTLAWFKPV